MDEINFFLDIEKSIMTNKYIELLDSYERKMIYFLSRFTSTCVFVLINKTIIFHNYNMDCKQNDYEKYERGKHCSLRMLLSLPEYYYKNIVVCGNEQILDYDEMVDELLEHLVCLEMIYYYYPCRNQTKVNMDSNTEFYMNYFKSYYFDYPEISAEKYIDFFEENAAISQKVFQVKNIKETIMEALVFQEFEKNLYSIRGIQRFICKIRHKVDFKKEGIWLTFPISIIQFLFTVKNLRYEEFIKKYVYNITDKRSVQYSRMIDVIASEDTRIALISNNNICFPRNYYWINRWYTYVWKSYEISKNNEDGKTYKSDKHENEIKSVLEKYFAKDKVYSGVYLKRKKGQYAEKDFIVVFNDYVISFEAKSKLLPAPFLGVEDGLEDIKIKCNEAIEKAIQQGNEIKQAIAEKKAFFYDTNEKEGKVVLDLNGYSEKKFIQVALMYEEFLNVETNIEHIYKDNINFWLSDVKTLDTILRDTFGKGEGQKFINYINKRMNAYGLIDVQSGEELKMYQAYKTFPVFFEERRPDIGIKVRI
jgi:hypothetical protein